MEAIEGEKKRSEIEEGDDGGVVMWSWGAGTDGQLGTGTLQDHHFPQPHLLDLPSSSSLRICRVACGGAHSIALTGDGRVVTWGRGTKGQLGHGELNNYLKPKLVNSFENSTISYVSAGWDHSGFITDSGQLFMCGDGSFGQLGTGDHQSHCLATEVPYFISKYVEQIACGMRHSLVLVRGPKENIIYGFGSSRHGQTGMSMSGPHRLKSCNSLPRVIHGFENHRIVSVYANGDQSAALSADGQLYTWGRGFGGSVGKHPLCVLPSSLRFSQVALGWNHALLIADDEVYMLGGKHHGLLNTSQEEKMKQQPSTSSANGTSDGSFLAPLKRVSCIEGRKAVHVAAGAEHSTLVTEDGKIMTWGWGEHGQLGLGDTNDQTSPCIVNLGYKGQHISGAQIRVYCGSGFTLVVKSV